MLSLLQYETYSNLLIVHPFAPSPLQRLLHYYGLGWLLTVRCYQANETSVRPPRLRCTLFPLIYPPHLLGSYKRQLYGFVLFSRLTKRNLASYVISVRRTKSLLTASFRFYLTIDTLAVQLYTSLSPRRVRDFHPLERTHGAQTKNSSSLKWEEL